jgi:hypothetical protein
MRRGHPCLRSQTSHLASLEAAESPARELVAARRETSTTIARLTDIVRDYGLGIAVPEMPRPSSADEQIASHIAMLLKDVSYGGEPSDVLEAPLANARAERERAAV